VQAGRRRTLVRAGVVVLLIGVFVVLPIYISTLPQFYSKLDAASDEHATWAKSTHAESSCEACHVAPGFLSQLGHRVRALGAVYLFPVSRKQLPKSFTTPTNGACVGCHITLRAVSPKGDLQIPHRAHVTVLKMDCVQCHNYLVHEKSAEGKHTPPMSGCLTCHDGETADNACTSCHTAKAAPESHKAKDWTIVHAEKSADPECAKCHAWTKNWCADCHARRPRSHTKDWRATHGDGIATRRNCEACHEAAFCERCHGELPKLNYDPALKLVQ